MIKNKEIFMHRKNQYSIKIHKHACDKLVDKLPTSPIFFVFFILMFLVLNLNIGAEEKAKSEAKEKPRARYFVRDEDKKTGEYIAIRLLDSTGKELKKYEFKVERKHDTDGYLLEFKAVRGSISGDGQYAAIATIKEEHEIAETKVMYIDTNNKILWEKPDIHPDKPYAQISHDGSRIAFIYGSSVVVYNKEGKELFKNNSYGVIRNIYLTDNGKYGYMYGHYKSNNKKSYGYTCFNIDIGEIHIVNDSEVPDGWINLTEDGEIIAEKGTVFGTEGRRKTGVVTHRYKFK